MAINYLISTTWLLANCIVYKNWCTQFGRWSHCKTRGCGMNIESVSFWNYAYAVSTFVSFMCVCICSSALSFFHQVVIHYSVSGFPWCLTAIGILCLEKMTPSSGRQHHLIPLFHSDCLSLLWFLTLTVTVYRSSLSVSASLPF